MSEFLMDNYIWIIVGIVLLMTIIGYIADKTDFGHKQILKRQKKEEHQQKEIETAEIDAEEKDNKEQAPIEESAQITDFWDNEINESLVNEDLPLEEKNQMAEIADNASEDDADQSISNDSENLEETNDLEAVQIEDLPSLEEDDSIDDDAIPLEEPVLEEIGNKEKLFSKTPLVDENRVDDDKITSSEEEIPSELYAPLEGTETSNLNIEELEKPLEEKLPDIPEEYFDLEEIGEQNLFSASDNEKEKKEEIEEAESKLPELDSKEESSSEDIWKF